MALVQHGTLYSLNDELSIVRVIPNFWAVRVKVYDCTNLVNVLSFTHFFVEWTKFHFLNWIYPFFPRQHFQIHGLMILIILSWFEFSTSVKSFAVISLLIWHSFDQFDIKKMGKHLSLMILWPAYCVNLSKHSFCP